MLNLHRWNKRLTLAAVVVTASIYALPTTAVAVDAPTTAASAPPVTLGPCTTTAEGASTCSLSVPAPPQAAPTYALVAKEGSAFTLLESQVVRYGSGSKWIEKGIAVGVLTVCSNDTFTDPFPGTVKRCEVRGGPAIDFTTAPPTTMPPMVDHSKMGPAVDAKLIPANAVGSMDARVRTTWRHTSDSSFCPEDDKSKCYVPDAEKPAQSDIGAFREPCSFAVMKYDDPIVLANQPGMSHLHTAGGNVGFSASMTTASMAATGSTCAGGSLNGSVYWTPSVIDTLNHRPLIPTSMLNYYKGDYGWDISKVVQALPLGLRMVAGSATNRDVNNGAGSFTCFGPDGAQGPTANTIQGATVGGTCKTGGTFQMGVHFPNCWDGVNLDSPNHWAHMSGTEEYVAVKQADGTVVAAAQGTPGSFWARRCPASHPKVFPNISYNFKYLITDDAQVARLRLASDPADVPAGVTAHADYWMHWNSATMQTFIDFCLKKNMDCHAWLLGDGTTLY